MKGMHNDRRKMHGMQYGLLYDVVEREILNCWRWHGCFLSQMILWLLEHVLGSGENGTLR